MSFSKALNWALLSQITQKCVNWAFVIITSSHNHDFFFLQQYSYCLFDTWQQFQSEITIELQSFCIFQWLWIKLRYRMRTLFWKKTCSQHFKHILWACESTPANLAHFWICLQGFKHFAYFDLCIQLSSWMGLLEKKKGVHTVQSTKVYINFFDALIWEKTHLMLVVRKENNHYITHSSKLKLSQLSKTFRWQILHSFLLSLLTKWHLLIT